MDLKMLSVDLALLLLFGTFVISSSSRGRTSGDQVGSQDGAFSGGAIVNKARTRHSHQNAASQSRYQPHGLKKDLLDEIGGWDLRPNKPKIRYDAQLYGDNRNVLENQQNVDKVEALSDLLPLKIPYHLCDYNLESLSGFIDLSRGERYPQCRWNISVPIGYILHIQSTVPLNKYSCPPDSTRIYVSEDHPEFGPTDLMFCVHTSTGDVIPYGFTTFTNQVSVQFFYGAGSDVDGLLFYQAIRESNVNIVKRALGEAPEKDDEEGSGEEDLDGIFGLSNVSYCLMITGETIISGNAPVKRPDCTFTIEPDNIGEEIVLKFLEIELSVPLNETQPCPNEDSFIHVRTWESDDTYQDAYVCTRHSEGREFRSSVRIQVFYQPSEHVSHGFRAIYRSQSISPGTTVEGDESDAHDAAIRNLWQLTSKYFTREHTLARILNDDDGFLSTIGYPHFYAKFRMRWVIIVEPGRRIKLHWEDRDLGYTPPVPCGPNLPRISIIYTPPSGDRVTYCGVDPPDNITSKSNKINIIFEPRNGLQGRGVTAHYTSFFDSFRSNFGQDDTDWQSVTFPSTTVNETSFSSECKVFTESSGNFSTPNYPNDYPSDYIFCWEVISKPNEAISLKFDRFNLDSLDIEPCDTKYSYVNISDYSSFTILCGVGEKPIFTSFTRRLKVSFDSILGVGLGFQASYSTFPKTRQKDDYLNDECNITETLKRSATETELPVLMSRCRGSDGQWPKWKTEYGTESAWMASPSFPERHPSPSHCAWVILGKHGQTINIHFPKRKYSSGTVPDGDCSGADVILSFKDCVSGDQQILCGDDIVSNYDLQFSNSVEIEFISRVANNQGFQVFYILQQPVTDELSLTTVSQSTTIETPFPVSTAATQLPRAPSIPMSTPAPAPGSTPAPTPGSTPTSTSASSPAPTPEIFTEIFTEIVTEHPLCQDTGSDECGGELVSYYGSFSSQLYPNGFSSDITCWWRISSPSTNMNLALKFLDVDLGVKSTKGVCDARYSYIVVNTVRTQYVVCDDQGPDVFISDSGIIGIRFSSLYSTGRGFCASFMEMDSQSVGRLADLNFPCACENIVINNSMSKQELPKGTLDPSTCQFLITGNSGTLPDDDFPSPYPPNSECVWTLLAEPGYFVRLAFLHLDLDDAQTGGRCLLSDTNIQVTLFDADNILPYRFCSGSDLSSSMPFARAVTVIFKSRNIRNNYFTGFSMSYAFVKDSPTEITENSFTTAVSNSFNDIDFRVLDDSSYDSWFSDSADDNDDGRPVRGTRKTPKDDRARFILPAGGQSITDMTDEITNTPVTTNIYSTDTFVGFDSTVGAVDEQLGDERMPTTKPVPLSPVIVRQPISVSTGDEPVTTPSPAVEEIDSTTARISRGSKTTTTKSIVVNKIPVIPEKGKQLTDQQIEMTIYVCTAVAAILVIALIILTLYCAKIRRATDKPGFDGDAVEEANYWQTYKDWAKDWAAEPIGSVRSTVDAVNGRDDDSTMKRLPSGDEATGEVPVFPGSVGHVKTVSAMVNQPPVEKPPRSFTPCEKLV